MRTTAGDGAGATLSPAHARGSYEATEQDNTPVRGTTRNAPAQERLQSSNNRGNGAKIGSRQSPQQDKKTKKNDNEPMELLQRVELGEEDGANMTLELPADELLMEAVCAREHEFGDRSVRNGSVWSAIAASLGDTRFSSGDAVELRVTWLQRAWAEKSNPVHGDLTDNLKQLIEKYRKSRAKKDNGNGKRRVVFDKHNDDPRKRKLVNDEDPREWGCAKDSATVGVDDDEQFPSLNKRKPGLDPTLEEKVMQIVLRHAPRLQTTEEKANVWETIASESRGRYSTGEQARARTAWLCMVLKKSDHEEHENITPTLQERLLEFLKFEPSPRRRLLAGKVYKPSEQTSKNELLMELVLEKQPVGARRKIKAASWVEIIAALQDPSIDSSKAVIERVNALVTAFQKPDHEGHTTLTVRLRQMISKYIRMKKRRKRSTQDDGDSDFSQDDEGSGVDDEETSVEDQDDGPPRPPTLSEKEALLRELLRVRPFHARRSQLFDQWSRVAAGMRCQFESRTTLTTGKACVVQMKRLLHAVRHPLHAELPERLVKMATFVDTLMKTRWPRGEEGNISKQRRLQLQIDEAIKSSSKRSTIGTDEEHRDLGASGGEQTRQDQKTIAEKPQSRGQKREQQRSSTDSAVDIPVRRRRPSDDCQSKDHRQHIVHADKIKSLQSEVAMFRAQMALQGDSFERERREQRSELRAAMEMLKEEREASIGETMTLLEILKKDQTDRRHECETMMELIKRSNFPRPRHSMRSS